MKFIFKRFTLVAVAILALLLVGCNADTTTLPSNTTTTMNTIDQLAMPEIGEEILVFKTNMGVIKARLFKEGIPETHKNFVFHVEEGNYDGTIFHRVMDGFMIQGGDIDGLDGMVGQILRIMWGRQRLRRNERGWGGLVSRHRRQK